MSDPLPPVEPHGSFQEVFPDVFWLQGSVRMGPGVRIPRNMVVLRHEGALTIVDAVRLDDAGRAALEALGRVENVVRLGVHGMDDAWAVQTFGAKTWARPGWPVGGRPPDHELVDGGPLPVPWLRLFVFHLTREPEVALIAQRDGGVLLTCDSVQHWPDTDGCSLLAKGLTVAMGFSARPANIGPPWRKRMTPQGGSLKADFERLLQEDFDHLIGGHGKPLIGGAKAALAATVAAVFGGS